jgi:hypothetical protein
MLYFDMGYNGVNDGMYLQGNNSEARDIKVEAALNNVHMYIDLMLCNMRGSCISHMHFLQVREPSPPFLAFL